MDTTNALQRHKRAGNRAGFNAVARQFSQTIGEELQPLLEDLASQLTDQFQEALRNADDALFYIDENHGNFGLHGWPMPYKDVVDAVRNFRNSAERLADVLARRGLLG